MLASTDMAGLTKVRIIHGSKSNVRKVKKREDKHYSSTGSGTWLWGVKGVYKDGLVSKTSISLDVHYI